MLPSMRPRALVSAFALYVLGCAGSLGCAGAGPGTQPTHDAAGGTTGVAGAGGKGGGAGSSGVGGGGAGVGGTGGSSAGGGAGGGVAGGGGAGAGGVAGGDASAPADAVTSDAPVDAPSDAKTGDAPIDMTVPRDTMPSEPAPPAPGKVYAHSADTLYLLEPISKQVTMVGTFNNCPGSMVDIAIDKNGKMTGAAAISFNGALGGAMVTVNPANAQCEVLSRGPNLLTSLSYVPEGTLLANAEALVGYAEDRYVRVDPSTGAVTDIGVLNNAASGGVRWISSGDVVSIKDGGTYLTVKAEGAGPGTPGGDRIVEVDPKTGALKRIIGATGMDDVLGLGYWGGVAYGFTIAGKLIQINLTTGAATNIPIPAAPSDLSFLGAGTTTVAPIIFE